MGRSVLQVTPARGDASIDADPDQLRVAQIVFAGRLNVAE